MSTLSENVLTQAADASKPSVPSEQQKPQEDAQTRAKKAKQISGETFLRLAEKKNTTVDYRIKFLKTKGFTAQEIFQCFEAVGQGQSMQTIEDTINSNGGQKHPQQVALPRQPQHHQAPSPYYIPPPVHGHVWKDYFIATTVISGLLIIAYKAACRYLPWEIIFKRKGEPEAIESDSRRSKRERRSKELKNQPELSLVPEPSTAPAMSASDSAPTEPSKDIQKLEADLAEKSDQYIKAMKEKAEMMVKVAQAKAQQTTASRSLENANKRIADLEGKLKAEQEANKQKDQPTESSAVDQQNQAEPVPAVSEDSALPAATPPTAEVKDSVEKEPENAISE